MPVKRRKRRTATLVAGTVAALLLVALLLSAADVRDLAGRAADVRWGWVVAASALALVSYGCIAGLQGSVLAILGHSVPAWSLLRTTTVAVVANRGLRSGGLTGYAVQAWLLSRRHGIPASDTLVAWTAHVLLGSLVFAALLLAAVAALALGAAPVGGSGSVLTPALLALAFSIAVALAWCALLLPSWRARWMLRAHRLVDRLGARAEAAGREHGVVRASRARAFLHALDAGLGRLVAAGRSTGAAWAWALLRTATSLGCLWACLRAAAVAVPVDVVALAYSVSKLAGLVALVPGGIGLIEGSLSGVLVAFDVDYEAALLGALLTRLAYQLVPAAVALALFWPLLVEIREEIREASIGGGPGGGASGGLSD